MRGPNATEYDVIVAGAGPVGLFLACELRLAKLSVLVLERAHDPHSPTKKLPFGLRGLSVATIESLDRRALREEINAVQPGGAHWAQQARHPAGHFAGITFFHDKIDNTAWPYRLPGPAHASTAVELQALETALAARAQAMGVQIRHGHAVEDVHPSDNGVVVHAGGQAFRGLWLVGCDGGRSTVRKAAGFTFSGTEPEFTGYSVSAELADQAALKPGRNATAAGMYTYAAPGTITMVDFDGGVSHRDVSLTREHVQTVLRRISCADITLTRLHSATTWTDRAFQATQYRKGRVLLAGDAAHIHSPLGGQGLNLGIGDAINLGWKLAATIRGDAPPGLLDSYGHERHPVGAQILDWSRAQVALMRPDPGARALASILRDLIETGDGTTYCAGRVWGLLLRYDLGSTHDLVGRSAPDFMLTDGTRVGDLLNAGKGLLLDFDAAPSLQALAAGYADRIIYSACNAVDRLGLSALLIRPDGIVAWAGEDAPDHAGAVQAAAQWFGDGTRGGLYRQGPVQIPKARRP